MKRPILLALVSVTASLPAAAQEDWSVWETDWKAEAGLVLSPGANEQALYRLGLGVDTNRVLDNGLVLGFALQLDAQQDHPARAGSLRCRCRSGAWYACGDWCFQWAGSVYRV
jgi:hypothetical protein